MQQEMFSHLALIRVELANSFWPRNLPSLSQARNALRSACRTFRSSASGSRGRGSCRVPGSPARTSVASSSSGAGLRRARRRRRHAPPGPGASGQGSTPAFRSRRRASAAPRCRPAAGPGAEPATTCYQSTSDALVLWGHVSQKTQGAMR